MKITYDPDADAMNIKFQSGKYNISKEIAEGIIVDYTKDGKVISMPKKSLEIITIGMMVKAA